MCSIVDVICFQLAVKLLKIRNLVSCFLFKIDCFNEMRLRVLNVALAAMLALAASAQTGVLPRSSAERQGVSSAAVANFVERLMAVVNTDVHHMVVARHGTVIAEMHARPYVAEDVHTMYSASKTVTALAVGIAIDENRLRVDDRVASFFPGRLPAEVSPALAAMTVRELLTMSTGVRPDYNRLRNSNDDWERAYLACVPDAPGQFQYDSMCTYMLAAIVQRVTGQTMIDYLRQRLFAPLGITVVDWELSPTGVNTGGWGLRLQAESEAKIGMLINNRGEWQGKRIVSASWIDEMTRVQINTSTVKSEPNDGNQGYGYQTWRCLPPGVTRADGAFGQYIIMDRERDLVVVINAMSHDGHGMLRTVWTDLLPMLGDAPLAENAREQKRLAKAIAHAEQTEIALPQGKRKGRDFELTLADNALGMKRISITGEGEKLCVEIDGVEYTAGYKRYELTQVAEPLYSITARNRFAGLIAPFKCYSAYAWQGNTLLLDRHWTTMISGQHLALDLDAKRLTVVNTFAPKKPIEIAIEQCEIK